MKTLYLDNVINVTITVALVPLELMIIVSHAKMASSSTRINATRFVPLVHSLTVALVKCVKVIVVYALMKKIVLCAYMDSSLIIHVYMTVERATMEAPGTSPVINVMQHVVFAQEKASQNVLNVKKDIC